MQAVREMPRHWWYIVPVPVEAFAFEAILGVECGWCRCSIQKLCSLLLREFSTLLNSSNKISWSSNVHSCVCVDMCVCACVWRGSCQFFTTFALRLCPFSYKSPVNHQKNVDSMAYWFHSFLFFYFYKKEILLNKTRQNLRR